MHATDPKVSRAMAMFQIRRYLRSAAPGAKLSAADILDYLRAAALAAQPADRLQTLILAIEGGLSLPPHQRICDRVVHAAVKKNPDIPDIGRTLIQIMRDISRFSRLDHGRFTVSLALNQPQFR